MGPWPSWAHMGYPRARHGEALNVLAHELAGPVDGLAQPVGWLGYGLYGLWAVGP